MSVACCFRQVFFRGSAAQSQASPQSSPPNRRQNRMPASPTPLFPAQMRAAEPALAGCCTCTPPTHMRNMPQGRQRPATKSLLSSGTRGCRCGLQLQLPRETRPKFRIGHRLECALILSMRGVSTACARLHFPPKFQLDQPLQAQFQAALQHPLPSSSTRFLLLRPSSKPPFAISCASSPIFVSSFPQSW